MSESITTEFVRETPQPYGEPASTVVRMRGTAIGSVLHLDGKFQAVSYERPGITAYVSPANTLEEAVQVVVLASGR